MDLYPISAFVSGERGAELKTSAATLRRMVKRGVLPARLHNGNRYLFTDDEVRTALYAPRTDAKEAAKLRDWAKKQAQSAPPLSREQISLCVTAFSDGLVKAAV